MRKAFMKILASLLLAAPLLGGCGDTPIAIGLSGQLEGKYSDLGVQGRNGAQLAVEEINASGGVLGRPLTLLAQNDGTSAEEAVAADEILRQAGVVAVVGHFTSAQSLAAVPAANEHGLLLLSPTTATPLLGGLDDMFLRVIGPNNAQAQALARYANTRLGAHRVLIIMDNDNAAFSKPYTEAYAKAVVTNGGRAVVVEFSSRANPDWPDMLELTKSLHFDALMAVTSARDAAEILRRLRVAGSTLPFFTSSWAVTKEFLNFSGKSAEGVVSCTVFPDDSEAPEYLAFSSRFHGRFGFAPNYAAVYSYEAVNVLAKALETTDGSARGLKEAILSIGTFDGLMGKWSFDRFGDARRPFTIITVRNGAFFSLETYDE